MRLVPSIAVTAAAILSLSTLGTLPGAAQTSTTTTTTTSTTADSSTEYVKPDAIVLSTKHTRISERRARAIARRRVPHAHVQSEQLITVDGHLVYSYELVTTGRPGVTIVNVDARSGRVRSVSRHAAM